MLSSSIILVILLDYETEAWLQQLFYFWCNKDMEIIATTAEWLF